MRALALDIGSSTIKGAVLDLDRGRLGATASAPFPPPLVGLPPGWVEVELGLLSQACEQVLARLLSAAPEAKRLYCSGQMGGLVLVSERGEPLSRFLSWRDQRTLVPDASGATCLDRLRERWPPETLSLLGNELQPGSTSSLLFWLDQHSQLPAGAVPATVADAVLAGWCEAAPPMHATQAIGLLDLTQRDWAQRDWARRDWARQALEALGLGRLRLPRLIADWQPTGSARVAGHRLQCYGSYGDQPCALWGARLAPGELSINISTGSQVSARCSVFRPGPYQSRCYFEGYLLNTLTHLPAGRSLNVLVDLLCELAAAEGVVLERAWQHLVARAEAADPGELEVDLAFFAGPLGNQGHIAGITTENLDAGRLFAAAFRTMADNYARCADRLGERSAWSQVVLSGGLAQSVSLLRRLIGARFAAPLRLAPAEETLLGLLAIAERQEG